MDNKTKTEKEPGEPTEKTQAVNSAVEQIKSKFGDGAIMKKAKAGGRL